MNKPHPPKGKSGAPAQSSKPSRPAKPAAPAPGKAKGEAKDKAKDKDRPRTHVSTEAARRRQHNAHGGSDHLDEGEELVRQLAALGTAVAGGETGADGRRIGQDELERMIRNCLRQRDDETLYEALEQLRFEDRRGHGFLRQVIEETADIVVLRRGEKDMEINAFLIPLLVRTQGGLDAERVLADGDDFDTLRASLQEAGLESRKARVVLVHHLYHPEEVDGLSYGDVYAMNRDAFASLTDKKVMSVPAIERSMRGWPAKPFAAGDEALELRFLLGFALKDLDDPFYVVPTEEAAADAYFAQRAARFQAWSEQFMPLVQRCLLGAAAGTARCEVHFLYQDLLHSARSTGNGEYRNLQLMAELEQGLLQAGVAAQDAEAVLAVAEQDGETVLEVRLRAGAGWVAQSAHVLDGDAQEQLLEAADAVASLGVAQLRLADGFSGDGAALRERALPV